MTAVLVRVVCVLLLLGSPAAQSPPAIQPAATMQAAPAAPRPRGLRIAGVAVNSLTGQPLASVSVAIAPATQGSERAVSQSVTTAADGRFAFEGLTRGKYSLMATARGYSLQYFEHHDPYATAIAVGPDLDSEHLVFRLQPDAAIEGEITDENNEPVQNATVRLFQASNEGGQQRTVPVNSTSTDDQGHYHFGHLAPGAYYVAVSARPWYAQNTRVYKTSGDDDKSERDFYPTSQSAQDEAADALNNALLDVTYPLTFYPGTSDSASATAVQLTPGEKTSADVALHAIPSLHLRIHTGATENPVNGRLAFPSVSQRIFEGYLDSLFNAPDAWVARGVVEVSGLAPGHYVVDMSPATGLTYKGEGRAWYREIDLTGDMEISASDGPSFASISGNIFFQDVPQVPSHTSIRFFNPETDETFRSDISAKGEFDLKGDDIRPGRYVVALEGASGFFLEKLSVTGAKLVGRTLEITGAGSVRIRGEAVRGEAQVDGTAMHGDEPLSGAMIVLVPKDPANNTPLFRRDQSDSDGTFTLPNVVPGQYTVIALANGWDLEWANPAVLQPYLKQGEKVQVPAGGKLQVKVQVQ